MELDVLIVDDEADICTLISDILKDEGYHPRSARNSTQALAALTEHIPSAVILDIWLKESELDGLGILETIKRKYPQVPVVIISGHGNIETAVNSIRMGAYDYIEKPFKADRLLLILKRAIETAMLKNENSELRLKVGPQHDLVGNSPSIVQIRQAIDRVAPTGSRVFITGPAGSGKQTIARLVHEKSHRKAGPFVVMNAAGLSPDTVDHELFGTEDDNDVNAPPRKVGLFEQASKGTLFIDEVTDLPLNTQGKFVRVLQENSFERVGGSRKTNVDVRVIAATNRDVQEEIAKGTFREDLYYRLNVVPLKAPNLHQRREDIPLLCDYFLKHFAQTSHLPERSLAEDAIAAMQAYDWPGNVRQLRNIIEWLLIMSPEEDASINSNMLPREIFSSGPAAMTPEMNTDIISMPLREAREVFERQYLTAQINRFGGNISRTSAFVGMERSALHRKLKSLDITSKNANNNNEGETNEDASANTAIKVSSQ